MFVPFSHECVESFRQGGFVSKVGNHQPLSLQDTEPLLDLIHPRAMDRWMVELESGMFFQPSLHLFASVHSQVIHHQMDFGDGGVDLTIQLLQELNELLLTFSLSRVGEDMANPSIEGCEEIQCTFSFVLMLDANRQSWFGRQCRRQASPLLQAGLLVNA